MSHAVIPARALSTFVLPAFLLLGAITAAAEPPPSRYRPLPRVPTLISGVTLLDGAGGRFERTDVLIDEGRIQAVGTGLARPPGVTLIDGTGRWLTPGLVDPHTHAGTFVLPRTAAEAAVSDVSELSDPVQADIWIEEAVRPTDPAFARALAGGVTTMQILPGSSNLFGGHSVIVKPILATTVAAMKFPDASPGFKLACGTNPAEAFGVLGTGPNSRMGGIAFMRRQLTDAQRHLETRRGKPHAKGDLSSDRGGKPRKPRERREGRELKLDALADVLEGDLPVHVHCYRADDMANIMALAEEFGFRIAAFHHASEAYKIAPLLRAHGACVAVWPDWWGFKREALDGIAENAAFVDAAGGCVTMHSDIPVLGDKLNLEAAKAAAAGRRAGLALPPERVIAWITSNPAATLGLGERIGRVLPGYNADLVLWSGDPFSVLSHADLVFIDGAVAFDRGQGGRRPSSDEELGRPERAVP